MTRNKETHIAGFTILPLEKMDAGQYRLQLSNSYGSDTAIITLAVDGTSRTLIL